MPSASDRTTSRRRWVIVGGAVALGTAVLLGFLITIRGAEPNGFDAEWMEEIVEHRSPIWEVPSRLMDFLGGGWFAVFVVPIAGLVGFLVAKRPWSALYYVLAVVASAAVVQLLKNLFGRARPEDILVVSDFGSFPSGHVANAATLAVAFGLILRRRWVWIVGLLYIVAMALSRTYLGAHWISDTIGGALVGAGVAVIVWAPLAYRLYREHRLPHPPIWVKVPGHATTASD